MPEMAAETNGAADGTPSVSMSDKKSFVDVSIVVGSRHAIECKQLVACGVFYAHGDHLRAVSKGSAGYNRLCAAIKLGASTERIQELLALSRVELIENATFQGETAVEIAVDRRRQDVIQLLVSVPAFKVPEAYFANVVSLALGGDTNYVNTPAPYADALLSCADKLALSPTCSPAFVGTNGCSNLSLAAEAGLVDMVRRWLQDPRCTAEVLAGVDNGGQTAFTRVCATVVRCRGEYEKGNVLQTRVARIVHCAQLLGWDSRNSPATMGAEGASQLAWAIRAGLADVLRHWVKDPRATKEAFLPEAPTCSLLEWATFGMEMYPYLLVAPEIGIYRSGMCVDILCHSEHLSPCSTSDKESLSNFHVACHAGAVNTVRTWINHKDVKSPLPTGTRREPRDHKEVSAWSLAVLDGVHIDRVSRDKALDVVTSLVTYGHYRYEANSMEPSEKMYLASAAKLGLTKIVQRWLSDDYYAGYAAEALDAVAGLLKDHLVDTFQFERWFMVDGEEKVMDLRECALILAHHKLAWEKRNDNGQAAVQRIHRLVDAGLGQALQAVFTHLSATGELAALRPHIGVQGAIDDISRALVRAMKLDNASIKQPIIDDCILGVKVLLDITGPDGPAPAADRQQVIPWVMSAFGWSCVRARDPSISQQQRDSSAACARLLASKGQVQSTDHRHLQRNTV